MAEHRHLRVTERGDLLILEFLGDRLHAHMAADIAEELHEPIAREGVAKILLDFARVEYACTDVIGKVVILNRKMQERGGKLTLCGICPAIRKILAVTKFDTILDIAEGEADALLAFV